MNLSISLGAFNKANLKESIVYLEENNYINFHIDVCANYPNQHLLAISDQIYDSIVEVHFMVDDESLLDNILQNHKVSYLALEFPICKNLLTKVKEKHPELCVGFSFPSTENLENIATYIDKLDFISVMSTSAGKSGLPINSNSVSFIQDLRQKYPNIRLHIDGGITPSILKNLKDFSINQFVSGSYLANSKCLKMALFSFEDILDDISA